jgi:hypothetical protein
MPSTKFAIGVLLLAIAAAATTASVCWTLWSAWAASNPKTLESVSGAFAGAFFAFMFVRLGDALNRIFARAERNQTALIRLQHYVNDCLNTNNDNIFVAEDAIRTFAETEFAAGKLPIFMNVPLKYLIDREVPLGLTNVDFVNDVYSLNVDLNKLNDSLATIDRANSELRTALLAGTIPHEAYLVNARRTRERYREVNGFLHATHDQLVEALATARLLAADAPFFVSLIRRLTISRHKRDFPNRLGQEIDKVDAEAKEIGEKSKEKIARAQSAA